MVDESIYGAKAVTELDLSALFEAPAAGIEPPTSPSLALYKQFTVKNILWKTADGGDVAIFDAETEYLASVTLQAERGWLFDGAAADAFCYDGASVEKAAISKNGAEAVVSISFTSAPWKNVDVSNGSGVAGQLGWIKANGVKGNNYIITLTGGETISPQDLSVAIYPKLANTAITLKGSGAQRTLTLSSSGTLFNLSGFSKTAKITFYLGENIKLAGTTSNTDSLIKLHDYATLIMKDGLITGNTNSGDGGGVYVNGGTFTMQSGIISGNAANYGGGVYVKKGLFTKTGGVIYGNPAGVNDKNTATTSGDAVYCSDGRKRNTTANTSMNSRLLNGDGGWE